MSSLHNAQYKFCLQIVSKKSCPFVYSNLLYIMDKASWTYSIEYKLFKNKKIRLHSSRLFSPFSESCMDSSSVNKQCAYSYSNQQENNCKYIAFLNTIDIQVFSFIYGFLSVIFINFSVHFLIFAFDILKRENNYDFDQQK